MFIKLVGVVLRMSEQKLYFQQEVADLPLPDPESVKARHLKLLIVNPGSFRGSYGKFAEAGGKNAPLGICYLAAMAERYKFPTQILDADILGLSLPDTVKRALKAKADVYCITAVAPTMPIVIDLVKRLRAKNPKAVFIVGGPQVSGMPVETVRDPGFDFGVFGEAEFTFLEMMDYLDTHIGDIREEDLAQIRGILWRKSDGRIVQNPPRPLHRNLDDLPPPALHLLPDLRLYQPQLVAYKYKPVATMMTSRGCPYQCIFCDKSVFGSQYRYHSPERVVFEIERLLTEFGIKEIKFLDDMFCLVPKRVERICDLILEKDLKFAWSCSNRVTGVTPALYKKMAKAGCWLIQVGIESGNQKVLDFIKKGITLEQIRQSVRWADEAGIRVRGFFQIGHAIDTPKTIRDTVEFAKSLPLNTAEFCISTPFAGTEFADIAKLYGDVNTSDLTQYSMMFAAFVPKGMTKEELEAWQARAHREFFLRPKKILDFAAQIRTLDDIKRYWTGFKVLMKL